jgi:hypothetical protein
VQITGAMAILGGIALSGLPLLGDGRGQFRLARTNAAFRAAVSALGG